MYICVCVHTCLFVQCEPAVTQSRFLHCCNTVTLDLLHPFLTSFPTGTNLLLSLTHTVSSVLVWIRQVIISKQKHLSGVISLGEGIYLMCAQQGISLAT